MRDLKKQERLVKTFSETWGLPQHHVLGLVEAVRPYLDDDPRFRLAAIEYCANNGIQIHDRKRATR